MSTGNKSAAMANNKKVMDRAAYTGGRFAVKAAALSPGPRIVPHPLPPPGPRDTRMDPPPA